MSGGAFEYKQYTLEDLADQIRELTYESNYSEKTINEFQAAIALLKLAKIYVHRIDYLVSCDDSEETFHKRLTNDMEELL